MDSYEATRIVFSKIQSLDPENASKIMGYILIQDHGDKEMIRLALGPDPLLHHLILKAKTHLSLLPNNNNSPSRPTPLSIPSSPPPSTSGHWPLSAFSDLRSPNTSLSYASIVNGTASAASASSLSSPTFPYYGAVAAGNNSGDLVDDYQLQDHLSFLNDSKADDLFDPRLEQLGGETHLHRRSYSVPGMCFGSEDPNSGFGWKPCLYFARGFCKNGSSCRFLHGDSADGTAIVGSPSKLSEFEQCQEILRSKAVQQQKLAAASQFMAGVGAATFPYSKCVNFLLQQENDNQRSAAAALMMGDELHKFGRCRPERNDFSVMGLGGTVNPGSRQIYLTFPADSTFREEDVSNYFSIYGPVHDVRIPYQQKRMFGFVTFVYPETVKLILAKGNPHFVCDSRVLVKPYKEKGKIPEKKQQQHMDRADYLACSSPTGLDARESYDLNLGARMFYNTQEMLFKRKLEEQADLQQAIELQERRLLNLQLLDLKNHHHHQFHQALSTSSPVPSPTFCHTPNNGNRVPSPDRKAPDHEGNGGSPIEDANQQEMNGGSNHSNENGNVKEEKFNNEECDLHESLEHILPDNLFASPKKSDGDHLTVFSNAGGDESTSSTTASSSNNNSVLQATSPLNMASLKSCFLQIPRFSSGHGTIGL